MKSGTWIMWVGAFLVGAFLISQLFQRPAKTMWFLLKSAVLGCLFVLAVNWIGGYFDFHLPFNPITALTSGLLGLPGVVALVAVKLWFISA